MKLYAITRGDYSDYHIITLTADKNVANQLAKRFKSNDDFYGDARIEEYEAGEIMLGKELYYVRMEDGNITDVREDYSDYNIYNTSVTKVKGLKGKEVYYTYVLTDSRDKAQKIGKDRIMKHVARYKRA